MTFLWRAVLWVHLLGMAFFVGGQLMLAAVVVPVARRSGDRDAIRGVARRFGQATLVAIGVLLASGIALATHTHLWSSSTLQLKLALVALVGVLVFWHMRRPALHAIEGAIFVVSLAIVWLGLVLAGG
jgi:uncharacterized membrane protein